jgi:hypothetical protein
MNCIALFHVAQFKTQLEVENHDALEPLEPQECYGRAVLVFVFACSLLFSHQLLQCSYSRVCCSCLLELLNIPANIAFDWSENGSQSIFVE